MYIFYINSDMSLTQLWNNWLVWIVSYKTYLLVSLTNILFSFLKVEDVIWKGKWFHIYKYINNYEPYVIFIFLIFLINVRGIRPTWSHSKAALTNFYLCVGSLWGRSFGVTEFYCNEYGYKEFTAIIVA